MNVDNTLMFLVVAKKSRTFSGFPYSGNEQVCRSWEGSSPGSEPKLANGNIPSHRHHAQHINGCWQAGRKLFCEFELHEICEFCVFRNCCSGTGSTIGCQVVRKIVLCISCFVHSSSGSIISFAVVLNCLYQRMSFTCYLFSSPSY